MQMWLRSGVQSLSIWSMCLGKMVSKYAILSRDVNRCRNRLKSQIFSRSWEISFFRKIRGPVLRPWISVSEWHGISSLRHVLACAVVCVYTVHPPTAWVWMLECVCMCPSVNACLIQTGLNYHKICPQSGDIPVNWWHRGLPNAFSGVSRVSKGVGRIMVSISKVRSVLGRMSPRLNMKHEAVCVTVYTCV